MVEKIAQYFRFLEEILRTRTIKQTLATTVGVLTTGILGLGFYVLMARSLGPGLFGIFSVAVATLTLLGDIFDFGTSTGLVRFVPKYLKSGGSRALKILKLTLEIKILSWLIILGAGWFFMPYVGEVFLQKPELIFPLRLSLIGVGGALLFSFATYSIQAQEKFWVWSGLNVSSNLFRLLLVAALAFLGLLTEVSGLVVYIAVPFLGFLAGLFFVPPFLGIKKEGDVLKELLTYNKWVAAFTLIAAFGGRLDSYLVTRLLSLKDIGVYSVGVQLSGFVSQIVFALATVAAPKLASFDSNEKAIVYLKKLQLLVIGLAVVGLLVGIPLSKHMIPLFYGQEYLSSVQPFIILLIAQSIFLISIPAHTAVIYYFSYPKLFFLISVVNLTIIGLLGYFLIGGFGYIGAAVSVLVGTISNLLIPAYWVIGKFKVWKKREL